jgi:hypothetical protein
LLLFLERLVSAQDNTNHAAGDRADKRTFWGITG